MVREEIYALMSWLERHGLNDHHDGKRKYCKEKEELRIQRIVEA